jgi:hypothetical protein
MMGEAAVTTPYNDDIPTFDGQPIFGPLANFTVAKLPFGTALEIDSFLGLTPGTTQYGADGGPGGRLWGITGQFIEATSEAVSADQATLLSFVGITARLGIPTYDVFPSDYQFVPKCYFVATDYAPSGAGIVSAPGGTYSLSYSLVIREIPD